MNLGHVVPGLIPDFAHLPELCARLELAGAHQVVLGEHLMLSDGMDHLSGSRLPWTASEPFPEPLTTLAAIAASTTRLRLSTGVLIAPLRSAVLLAKSAATVDALSGGRLDLGLGAGWWEPEFAAAGVDPGERLGRLEEAVAVCRALWSPGPASYAGRWTQFREVESAPRPARAENCPIWIGAGMGPRMAQLIASSCDGWIGRARMSPDELARASAVLDHACETLGRDPSTVARRAFLPWPDTWDDGLAALSLDQLVRASHELADAGASHVVLPWAAYVHHGDDGLDLISALAEALSGAEVA